MSFDKAIKYGKEKRKPYTGAKAKDTWCRNHGNCDWCKDDRLYQAHKKEEACNQKMKDYQENNED